MSPYRQRLAAAAAALLAALAGAPAASALETRTLLLDQRITPSAAPPSTAMASRAVALAGETVALQVAIRARTAALVVHPSVVDATADWLPGATRLLRVGFVRIATPSTGTGARPGMYPDPLPRLTTSGLAIPKGTWGGLVVLVRVPADAPAGTVTATLHLDAGGDAADVPLSIHVAAARAIGTTSASSFRLLFLDNGPLYATLDPLPRGTADAHAAAARRRTANLLSFLAEHGAVPLRYPFASPDASGRYPGYSQPGSWWKDSAGNLSLAMGVEAPARVFPVDGRGFSVASASAARVRAWLANAFRHWRGRGYLDRSTYALVWDEPSPREEATRVPLIDRALHASAPGVKALSIMFPRVVVPRRRICKTWGDHACYWSRGNDYTNEHLWDGGSDDVDAIVVLDHRYYGTWTSPLERANHIDHDLETYRVVQRARKRGKEILSYEYTIGVHDLPTLSIDAPATDVSTLLWWNALEGTTGFLHWGYARYLAPGSMTRMRDPYANPLSWVSGRIRTNGEASLIYPALAPRYGLRDATAEPVSSLRLERMRRGVENANLVAQARRAAGDAAVTRVLGRIFGPVATLRGNGYTWRSYTRNPVVYEQVRRSLIALVERG